MTQLKLMMKQQVLSRGCVQLSTPFTITNFYSHSLGVQNYVKTSMEKGRSILLWVAPVIINIMILTFSVAHTLNRRLS